MSRTNEVAEVTRPTGKYARLSITNISGQKRFFRDWFAAVAVECDRVNLSEAVRGVATGPMMVEAWKVGETPAHFVASLNELV